jgi:hypothetical protein
MNTESGARKSRDEWQARFLVRLEQDPSANAAWKSLTVAGVDAAMLSGLLSLTCDVSDNPALKLIESFRRESLAEARSAVRLADRMEADREELLAWGKGWPDGLIDGLATAVERIRTEVKEMREIVTPRILNSKTLMAWLITSIQETTGSPHYREIARLRDCAYLAYGGEPKEAGEEALRKAHSRFMRNNPLRGLVSPKGKRNVQLALLGFIVVEWISNRERLPVSSESSPATPPIDLSNIFPSWPDKKTL